MKQSTWILSKDKELNELLKKHDLTMAIDESKKEVVTVELSKRSGDHISKISFPTHKAKDSILKDVSEELNRFYKRCEIARTQQKNEE